MPFYEKTTRKELTIQEKIEIIQFGQENSLFTQIELILKFNIYISTISDI